MADDFQMKMLSLMAAYGLVQDQRENSFYFSDIPEENVATLYQDIKNTTIEYNRRVTITKYENNIIVDDGGQK